MHQPVAAQRTPEDIKLVEQTLVRIFGRNAWATYVLLADVPEGTCDCTSCPNPAITRVYLNVWGSLMEYNSCREHQYRNGFLVDAF